MSGGLRPERNESGEAPEGRTAFAQSESLGRAANRQSVTTGEAAAEKEDAVGELWKDGPVWTVRGAGPEVDEAQRPTAEWRTAQAEEAFGTAQGGDPGWAGLKWAVAERSGPGQDGLEGLYRQTVRGLRPAAPALLPEQAGKTARAQEPGSAASLAVDELDRAVRRDSRRYDGGMSIF